MPTVTSMPVAPVLTAEQSVAVAALAAVTQIKLLSVWASASSTEPSEERQAMKDPRVTRSPRSPGWGFLGAVEFDIEQAEGDVPSTSSTVTATGGLPMLAPPVSLATGDAIAAKAPLPTELVPTGGGGRALQTLEVWGGPRLK